MPPPTAVLQPKSGAVKTPRPDFTIGLRHSTVSTALRKRGLNKFQAEDFLNFLQREQLFRSDPTQNFLDIRCPILVIEGKAYATGKTTFEAQNQAAVSGSCMVNLQQQLIDLFNNVFSVPQGRESPLAFSICTEGPHMELWVHYAASEYNMRSHYMNIIRTCYGSLHHELENFLLDVERLMQWTKEGFLAEIADRLCELASHATRG